MYTCVLNPSITDVEYARVFDDSWAFMSEQFGGATQEAARANEKHKLSLQNTLVTYEDGYLLSIYGADAYNNKVTLTSAFYGYALDGSKNYLHNAEWLTSIQTVLNANYDKVFWGTVAGSSIDNHVRARKAKIAAYFGEATQDEVVDTEGTSYNVLTYPTLND